MQSPWQAGPLAWSGVDGVGLAEVRDRAAPTGLREENRLEAWLRLTWHLLCTYCMQLCGRWRPTQVWGNQGREGSRGESLHSHGMALA